MDRRRSIAGGGGKKKVRRGKKRKKTSGRRILQDTKNTRAEREKSNLQIFLPERLRFCACFAEKSIAQQALSINFHNAEQ